jgi:hypothetical protein
MRRNIVDNPSSILMQIISPWHDISPCSALSVIILIRQNAIGHSIRIMRYITSKVPVAN